MRFFDSYSYNFSPFMFINAKNASLNGIITLLLSKINSF